MFTSTNPLATTARISANLVLDGILEASGNVAAGSVETTVIIFGVSGINLFRQGYNLDIIKGVVDPPRFTNFENDLIVDSGIAGPTIDLQLHTPFVTVPLNQPVGLRVRLAARAVASGPDTHGLADFGANSFKLPTGRDAFSLPDGVTVNAGTYLVNNRFFDPLRPVVSVPEPTTCVLMLLGIGAIGASRSRRRGLVQARA